MIVFLPVILWVPTLLPFALGVQIVVRARFWGRCDRVAGWCAALNLCEPAVNVVVVTVLYLTVDSISFVSDAAIPFAFTAPMLLVISLGLGVWYGTPSCRRGASMFARQVAREVLGLGVLRYVLTTAIWLCVVNVNRAPLFLIAAAIVSVCGFAVLVWCWVWGRRLLDADPAANKPT